MTEGGGGGGGGGGDGGGGEGRPGGEGGGEGACRAAAAVEATRPAVCQRPIEILPRFVDRRNYTILQLYIYHQGRCGVGGKGRGREC